MFLCNGEEPQAFWHYPLPFFSKCGEVKFGLYQKVVAYGLYGVKINKRIPDQKKTLDIRRLLGTITSDGNRKIPLELRRNYIQFIMTEKSMHVYDCIFVDMGKKGL